MENFRNLSVILIIFFIFSSSCKKTVSTQQSIIIENPWIRLVPSSAKVTAGYAIIHNHGQENTLLEVSSNISEVVELHEMIHDGSIMKMRKKEDGFAIGSHKTLHLKPGGYHIMFINLTRQLQDGELVPVQLKWKNGETMNVEFKVALDLDSSPSPNHHE